MIEVHPVPRAVDTFTVTVTIVLVDRGGTGIKKMRVLDRFGAPIDEQTFDCPPTATAVVGPVERDRLPISVEATDCSDVSNLEGPFPLVGPHDARPGIPIPCSALRCVEESEECRDAQNRVQNNRIAIIEECAEVSRQRATRDFFAALAAAFFAAAIALAAVAAAVAGIPIFGQAAAAVCIGLAAGFLIGALTFTVLAAIAHGKLIEAQGRLDISRRLFAVAVDDVGRLCCPGCITVDLTQPECP